MEIAEKFPVQNTQNKMSQNPRIPLFHYYMLCMYLGKHAIVSIVTLSNLQLRGSKVTEKSNVKHGKMAKLTMPTCWPYINMHKCPQ